MSYSRKKQISQSFKPVKNQKTNPLSIIQPQFESTDLLAAHNDLIFKRRYYFHDHFSQEITLYFLDSLNAHHCLPVRPEKTVRIELLAQLIQRQIYNVLLIWVGNGKSNLIFRIAISSTCRVNSLSSPEIRKRVLYFFAGLVIFCSISRISPC